MGSSALDQSPGSPCCYILQHSDLDNPKTTADRWSVDRTGRLAAVVAIATNPKVAAALGFRTKLTECVARSAHSAAVAACHTVVVNMVRVLGSVLRLRQR